MEKEMLNYELCGNGNGIGYPLDYGISWTENHSNELKCIEMNSKEMLNYESCGKGNGIGYPLNYGMSWKDRIKTYRWSISLPDRHSHHKSPQQNPFIKQIRNNPYPFLAVDPSLITNLQNIWLQAWQIFLIMPGHEWSRHYLSGDCIARKTPRP